MLLFSFRFRLMMYYNLNNKKQIYLQLFRTLVFLRDPTVSISILLKFMQQLILSRVQLLLFKASPSGSGAHSGRRCFRRRVYLPAGGRFNRSRRKREFLVLILAILLALMQGASPALLNKLSSKSAADLPDFHLWFFYL